MGTSLAHFGNSKKARVAGAEGTGETLRSVGLLLCRASRSTLGTWFLYIGSLAAWEVSPNCLRGGMGREHQNPKAWGLVWVSLCSQQWSGPGSFATNLSGSLDNVWLPGPISGQVGARFSLLGFLLGPAMGPAREAVSFLSTAS